MYVLLLKYNGTGEKPIADIDWINRIDGVEVVNSQLPRMLVVQVRGDKEKCKLMTLSNWSLNVPHTSRIDIDVDASAAAKNGFVVSRYLRSIPK